MVATVTISSAAIERIRAAAAADPAQEVCGLLFGTATTIAAAEPCDNVAADPAVRFEIDPVALLAAHRRARAGGPAIVGCYHSHPAGRAEPSPRDAADAAADGAVWLIAAAGIVRAWRAVPNGALHGRFDPLALHCDAGAASTRLKNEENR